MNLIGYSERGMIYSLVSDLITMDDISAQDILQNVISKIVFLSNKDVAIKVNNFDIIIEQSFSEFGDADLIFVLNDKTINVFIEAKVNTASGLKNLDTEFQEFDECITKNNPENKLNSSNLFTQLYHKMVMMKHINDDKLFSGIHFPNFSTRSTRKIGKNPGVLKALEFISRSSENNLYIALVPDTKNNIINFKSKYFKKISNLPLDNWNTENIGFINYHTILECLPQNGFFHKNHEINKEQIYGNGT